MDQKKRLLSWRRVWLILGVEAVLESLDSLQGKPAVQLENNIHATVGQAQDESKATKAPRIAKQDGFVHWEMTAIDIDRRRRAFVPWPRLTAFVPHMNGIRRLVCLETEVVEGQSIDANMPPGCIVEINAR